MRLQKSNEINCIVKYTGHLNFPVSVCFLMQFIYASSPDDTLGLIIPFQVTLNECQNLESCKIDLKNIALQPNFLGYN